MEVYYPEDLEVKVVQFIPNIKSIKPKERTFEGELTVFNEVDSWNDRTIKGAFKRTLDHHRNASEKLVLYDNHMHTTAGSLGWMIDGKETQAGVDIKAEASDTPEGDSLLQKIKEKLVTKLSYGYKAIKVSYTEDPVHGTVRNLEEIALREISTAQFPALDSTVIDATSVKSVTPMQSFALDKDSKWDGDKAIKALKIWASSDNSGKKATIDFKKYQTGFLYVDTSDVENFKSYKLPYVDVVDDRPKAIWECIKTMGSALQRGSIEIPDEAKAKVRKNIEGWYHKANEKPPWKGMIFLAESIKAITGDEWELSKEDLKTVLKDVILSDDNKKLLSYTDLVIKALLEEADSSRTLGEPQESAINHDALLAEFAMLKLKGEAIKNGIKRIN